LTPNNVTKSRVTQSASSRFAKPCERNIPIGSTPGGSAQSATSTRYASRNCSMHWREVNPRLNCASKPLYRIKSQLDTVWTDEFMATGAGTYRGGVMYVKDTELLSIAFGAFLHTHVCARYSSAHSQRPASGRDDGKNHGSLKARGCPRCPSLQSRRANSRRGAGEPAADSNND